MTGPEHYAEAERLLELGSTYEGQPSNLHVQAAQLAQGHALLAFAAATALAVAGDLPVADHDAWWAAAGSEPVYREVTT